MSTKDKEVRHRSCDVLGIDADEWDNENRRMTIELREQQHQLRKALEDRVQVIMCLGEMATQDDENRMNSLCLLLE
uniref:Uncharacterized protein n=1 Tax=Zea mays TaxID=4577 RepID=A0A804R6V4_MAIZE